MPSLAIAASQSHITIKVDMLGGSSATYQYLRKQRSTILECVEGTEVGNGVEQSYCDDFMDRDWHKHHQIFDVI